jgi:pyruvate/2-oxoglutarate dehydrogenase complex dihydrolipoamide acyltransferase (E2) component
MPTRVTMPQLGESVVEGTVSKWLKHEGDSVSEFEPLLEISTDKVDTELPSPAAGTLLKIYIPEGQTVERGVLLALIGQPGEDMPEQEIAPAGTRHVVSAPQSAPVPFAQPATISAKSNGGVSEYTGHITPVVARMVAEHGVDLAQIKGTGRDGRVTKKDVEAYLESRPAATELPPWERPGSGDLFKPTIEYSAATESVAPQAVVSETPKRVHPVEPIPAAASGELVHLTPMRRAIAEHMVRSKLETSPHVTTVFELDMSAVLAHREANLPAFAKQGVNLTLTAYFVAATVTALRANPYLNSQWTDDGIYLHNTINVGIAVALDDGLIVPVIKNAQDLNLLGLARAVNDLASRGRSKQLRPDEVQGGTFTITNHGVSGSLFATPIINQPQVGILGVGMMEKRVKVINDAIAIRPCVYVSLTFDHRVVDGATGDAFMLMLKQTLENWG